MLSELLNWVRQVIYVLIFLTLLLQILPGENYKKYVKFFAGLIFVVTLFRPVVSLFSEQSWESMLEEAVTEEIDLLDKNRVEQDQIRWGQDGMQEPDFQEMEARRAELYEKYQQQQAQMEEKE